MPEGTKEPSSKWKKTILLAEHSPIRKLVFSWKWINLPYWVSVHFVRHKFGIEHFVSTQRTDRTGTDRTGARQDAPVEHECFANAQAVMFISRRRLCSQASPETRAAAGVRLSRLLPGVQVVRFRQHARVRRGREEIPRGLSLPNRWIEPRRSTGRKWK